MKKFLLFLKVFFLSNFLLGQDIYKTPYGEKYHLSDCRMVENVARKLLNDEDIRNSRLEPCKICKPPIIGMLEHGFHQRDKSVGSCSIVQCKGRTKKGTRCKHKTRLCNGYCYQHTYQNSNNQPFYFQPRPKNKSSTTICGARTKSGGYCKRKVKGGVHCYQH